MPKRKKGSSRRGTPHSLLGQLQNFRFLAIVIAAASALCIFEANNSTLPDETDAINPSWVLDPRNNFPDVLMELYPNRSKPRYWRGFQAALCLDFGYDVSPVCEKFRHRNMNDVRQEFARAIANGEKSNEKLFYNYAHVLLMLGESEEKVNEAIRAWRLNYPHSSLKDPRLAFQKAHDAATNR